MEEEILGYEDSGATRLFRGDGCRHGLIENAIRLIKATKSKERS